MAMSELPVDAQHPHPQDAVSKRERISAVRAVVIPQTIALVLVVIFGSIALTYMAISQRNTSEALRHSNALVEQLTRTNQCRSKAATNESAAWGDVWIALLDASGPAGVPITPEQREMLVQQVHQRQAERQAASNNDTPTC